MALPGIDFDSMYDEIATLAVDVNFTTELGFPYLQAKLAEIFDKRERAAGFMTKVLRWNDAVAQEVALQQLLSDQTVAIDHRQALAEAKAVKERLRTLASLVRLRMQRLREMSVDFRQYVNLMREALDTERGRIHRPTQELDEVPLDETALFK